MFHVCVRMYAYVLNSCLHTYMQPNTAFEWAEMTREYQHTYTYIHTHAYIHIHTYTTYRDAGMGKHAYTMHVCTHTHTYIPTHNVP